MASLVIDASVTLAWMLPGEAQAARARETADRVATQGGVAPSLWRLEVANGLLSAVRRGRIPSEAVGELLGRLASLPVAMDGETAARAWDATTALAQRHALTAYDAAYLELAVRRRLPLASDDQALRAATQAEGVALV